MKKWLKNKFVIKFIKSSIIYRMENHKKYKFRLQNIAKYFNSFKLKNKKIFLMKFKKLKTKSKIYKFCSKISRLNFRKFKFSKRVLNNYKLRLRKNNYKLRLKRNNYKLKLKKNKFLKRKVNVNTSKNLKINLINKVKNKLKYSVKKFKKKLTFKEKMQKSKKFRKFQYTLRKIKRKLKRMKGSIEKMKYLLTFKFFFKRIAWKYLCKYYSYILNSKIYMNNKNMSLDTVKKAKIKK